MTHLDMSKRLAIALACLSALFVSACGDRKDSSDDERVDSLAALLQEDWEEDARVNWTDGERRCLVGEMIAGLDDDVVDELLAENTFNDPPPGVMLVMADAMFSCVSVTQMMVDLMVADGATQEEAECFANGFDEEFMRMMVTSDLTGEEPSPEEEETVMAGFFEVMMTCGG